MENLISATMVTDNELDAVIQHLRTLYKQHSLSYAVATGQFIVDKFYNGDFTSARDRNATNHFKFNELIERRSSELRDLDLNVRSLSRYVAATEVWNELPEHTRAQLRIAHLDRLAMVGDIDERKRLAHEAATMHWTAEQTGLAVADYKKKQRGHKKKAGPKLKPAVLKAAMALHRDAKALRKLHGAAANLNELHKTQLALEMLGIQKALAGLA